MSSTVICGVDCSGPSLLAARLARSLARASGRPVNYVYVARTARQSYAISHVRAATTGGPWAATQALRILTGAPAERLAQSTRHAAMLVLGTRAMSALRHALTGSVSTAVTRAARLRSSSSLRTLSTSAHPPA